MDPIILVGKNLGERHNHLNRLVNEAYKRKLDVCTIEDLHKESPIDRIFKIDLASKNGNLDYIIRSLKDDDMLYVSKALKCKWLLEPKYQHIINPHYLEDELFPLMRTTAVTKMLHWLHSNLHDEQRCQQFYQHYCDTNFKVAVKFLRSCSSYFVLEQFSSVIHKISIAEFEKLCKNNIYFMKMFFDSFETDEELKKKYLKEQSSYFEVVKHFIKVNPEVVLDITEKYFNDKVMKPYTPKATKFIVKYQKQRFIQKQELYTAFLLNLNMLASLLSSEESINLLIKLSKDKYLKSKQWFDYKKVEPLINRLQPKDRGAMKKKLFVDKDIEDEAKEWPYPKPTPPVCIEILQSIFVNTEVYSDELEIGYSTGLKRRKYAKWQTVKGKKTMLDKLYDEYRVASFEKTFFELRNRLKNESSQNREYMMLVLVSKSGGHEDNISKLVELLLQYINEPCQIRATVIRSLVKRAYIWRIREEIWMQLLKFAHGLGLNGKPPEVNCHEIIHAAVIRQILITGSLDPALLTMFVQHFSTLVQFGLSNEEKTVISDLLPKILLSDACAQTEIDHCIDRINKLLDTLNAFRVPIIKVPGLISKIKSLAQTDILKMDQILRRLFKAKIARTELFYVNCEIINSEHSFLNILRHDTEVLSPQMLIKYILYDKLKYNYFFQKISIYFSEKDGLTAQFLRSIQDEGFKKPLARPLSILIGNGFEAYLRYVDNSNDAKDLTYAAALRANAHLPKPAFNIDAYGWDAAKVKAVANRVVNCRQIEVNGIIKRLIANKKTVKLGLTLAKRTDNYNNIFRTVASSIRPAVAFKTGLKILKAHEQYLYVSHCDIWNIIKPIMENLDITLKSKKYLFIDNINSIPKLIRPEYAVIVYEKIEIHTSNITPYPYCIEKYHSNINEKIIERILLHFLSEFVPTPYLNNHLWNYNECMFIYIRILVRYLLLSKSEAIQKQKFESIGLPFFRSMEIWMKSKYKILFKKYLNEFLITLKYFKVFLNMEYVNCLPIMEKVLDWMKSILPVECYFNSYVFLSLNMLYYKAIQKSINTLEKKCFDDSNEIEARKLVGNIFGKYIAQEANELRKKYFDSVTYINKNIILNLETHFVHFDSVYATALINGIMDTNEVANNILSIYLFKHLCKILKEHDRAHIMQRLKDCTATEVQMILFAEIYY